MEGIYRTPLRVYLVLAILSLAGLYCAIKLPVSLFPNSSKPHIRACLNIDLAPDAFLREYRVFVPSDCVISNNSRENLQALRLMERVLKADIRSSRKLNLAALKRQKRQR